MEQAISENLSSYLSSLWSSAYASKQQTHERLLGNLRAFNSTYSVDKLMAIKELGGSEDFLPLTTTKCNAAISWLKDLIIPYKDKAWTVVNTPAPEYDQLLLIKVTKEVMLEVSQKIALISMYNGINPEELLIKYEREIQDKIRNKLNIAANEITRDCERIIEDQLVEGNWFSELPKVIFDVVVFPAGILKAPVYRKTKKLQKVIDQTTGYSGFEVVEEIKPFFDRVSPFNIFPSPNSTNTDDGYIFEVLTLTPSELATLKGLPNYDEDAIDKVLSLENLGNWTTAETEVNVHSREIFKTYDNVIEALEFWGDVKGELLIEWGLTENEVPDKNSYYPIQAIKIKDIVIKAMINPDPLGRRVYLKTSYLNIPGSFWGSSLVDLLSPMQRICNAATRAVVNNCGFACAPITEVSVNRFPKGKEISVHPMMTIESTDTIMSGSPAVRFYQPNMVVDQLLRMIDFFSNLADNYSIPSYAHGSSDIGGIGNTASGLQMLMGASNRIIKNVVSNFDCLIEATLNKLYSYNLLTGTFSSVGDMTIRAKGSSHLIHKEHQMLRRTEFLRETNNAVDLSIIGADGRRELLYEAAKTMDFENLERIVKEHNELDYEYKQLTELINQSAIVQKKGQQQVDGAGNAMSGQDYRLTQQSEVSQ